MSSITRREFIKLSSVAGAATAFAAACASAPEAPPEQAPVAEPSEKEPKEPVRMALLMDNSLCVNCQSCRLACQNENNLPVSEKYIRFDYVDSGSFPSVRHHVNRHSCQHCSTAPCVDICPVDALYKGEEGFTHMEFETCIGCGACLSVCPFEVPVVSQEPESGAPKMYKCNACKHLIVDGGVPACATTCITNAVDYGPWDEMLKKAEDRVAVLRQQYRDATVYGETQQDGLGLILVLRTPPEDYPHLV